MTAVALQRFPVIPPRREKLFRDHFDFREDKKFTDQSEIEGLGHDALILRGRMVTAKAFLKGHRVTTKTFERSPLKATDRETRRHHGAQHF